jgi:copper resistance protein D
MIIVRAVHFVTTIVAAGTVLFIVFIAGPALREAGGGQATRVRSKLARMAWTGLELAVISGVAWLILTAAGMSGRPPAEIFASGALLTVLTDTTFGRVWIVRLFLACLIAALLVPGLSAKNRTRPIDAALVISAAAFAGTLAWAGHAAGGLDLEAFIHPLADVLHLIAAAAWVGALLPLALLLKAAGQEDVAVAQMVTLRFSTLGIASVGTLLVTGIVNAWYLAGSIPALIGTDYGRLLLIKITLFFGMVAIAGFNRLRLTPRIAGNADAGVIQDALRLLRRNAAIEAAAGAMVLIIVAVLGTLPPANHANHTDHHATYGPVPADAAFVHIHTEQGMADVTILPGRVGTADITVRLWNDDLETLDVHGVMLTLTAPGAGSRPATRAAAQNSDESWQVGGVELSQAGNWTVAVSATLASGRHLVLDAPIVIEP